MLNILKKCYLILHYFQSKEVAPIDQYLVCGEHYKTIRDAVAKVVLEGQTGGLDETCEVNSCAYIVIENAYYR